MLNVLGTGAIFVLDTLSEISSFWSETCRLGRKIWCLKELNDQLPAHACQELLHPSNQHLLVLELGDGGDVLLGVGDVECAGDRGHLRVGHLVRDL